MGLCCSGDSLPPINPDRVDSSHFELYKVVGKGGFGKVNACIKRDTKEILAMKHMQKATILAKGGKRNLEALWVERDLMCVVKSPFVVNLLYAFQNQTEIFFIMPFMKGGDLRYYLQRNGAMSEEQARFYACELILAFEELYRHRVVYRDLKPDNVLLDENGHARLSDFGLAVFLTDEHHFMARGTAGTTLYQAPEVITHHEYNHSCDVFSFGIFLYELLHKQLPFAAEIDVKNNAHVHYSHNLQPECIDLMKRLMEHDVNKRIGCGPEAWEEIKRHEWFKGIDWGKVERKEYAAPFLPDLERANCHPIYELQDQLFPEENHTVLSDSDQKYFEGLDWNVDLKHPDVSPPPASPSAAASSSSSASPTGRTRGKGLPPSAPAGSPSPKPSVDETCPLSPASVSLESKESSTARLAGGIELTEQKTP